MAGFVPKKKKMLGHGCKHESLYEDSPEFLHLKVNQEKSKSNQIRDPKYFTLVGDWGLLLTK